MENGKRKLLPTRPDAYAFILTLVVFIIIGVLLMTDRTVPSELWLLAGASSGTAIGINVKTP